MSITTYATTARNIASKSFKVLCNRKVAAATGATAVGLSAYNTVVDGLSNAQENTNIELGDKYVDMFVRQGASNSYCNLLNEVKGNVTLKRLDSGLYTKVVGLKQNVLGLLARAYEQKGVIALGAGALAAPAIATKIGVLGGLATPVGAVAGGICTGLLVLNGANILLNEVFGIGKNGA